MRIDYFKVRLGAMARKIDLFHSQPKVASVADRTVSIREKIPGIAS